MSDDWPAGFTHLEPYQPPEIIREPHPEVVRWVGYTPWPTDKPFPLTPLEAWYVMQGFTVKPAATFTLDEFMQFPGDLEGGPNGVMLRQR